MECSRRRSERFGRVQSGRADRPDDHLFDVCGTVCQRPLPHHRAETSGVRSVCQPAADSGRHRQSDGTARQGACAAAYRLSRRCDDPRRKHDAGDYDRCSRSQEPCAVAGVHQTGHAIRISGCCNACLVIRAIQWLRPVRLRAWPRRESGSLHLWLAERSHGRTGPPHIGQSSGHTVPSPANVGAPALLPRPYERPGTGQPDAQFVHQR